MLCLHLVKLTSYSALQDYTKYLHGLNPLPGALSPVALFHPLFCASLSLSNLLQVSLSLFLFQSLSPPCLPTHSNFSLSPSPSVYVCACVCLSPFLSPSLSILFMHFPRIPGRVKKMIPWFSAERQ